MIRVVIVVCGVLVGWSVALGQAGGKGDQGKLTPTKTEAKLPPELAAKLKEILGTGVHAKTATWAALQFRAARSAKTEKECDQILLALKTRLEQIVKTTPEPKSARDHVDLLALTGWIARIEGCAQIRRPIQRLLVGRADKADKQAILVATKKALDRLDDPMWQADDIIGSCRSDMRQWIVCKNYFTPACRTLGETTARLRLYSGLAEHNATLRKLQLTKALKARPFMHQPDPAAAGQATILTARCHLALAEFYEARTALKPLTDESRRIDESTIRAHIILARCVTKGAQEHLTRARATLPAIFNRHEKALLDAELTLREQPLLATPTLNTQAGEKQILADFIKRNPSCPTVLASLLDRTADSPGLFLHPTATATVATPGNVTFAEAPAGLADNVVFVIDRSGSMVTVFDYARLYIQLSIADLRPTQKFHLVFFADSKAIEGPSDCLVPATPGNKVSVVDFLSRDALRPAGYTTVWPALKLAFDVLDKAPPKSSKMIILATDGEFPVPRGGLRYAGKQGNEAVVKWLKDNNDTRGITISTYLFGNDERAVKVLTQIANEHKGRFKIAPLDE